uniref:Uncharacterized protein n=1 Tax=Candidatus Kentrum sp. LPFa TaxID=2126335 RepID=A0A450XWC9_9GAMM|nr:MAG: hypothetical protein BECKLPF1236C_GA0070990_102143 [Candidatus Kentron sp. LPFa]
MPTDAPNKTASPPPSVQHARIDAGHEGQRIDNFLMGRLKGVPRAHVYRILRRGEARVNKGRVRPDYRLRMDDIVRIPPLRYRESATDAPNAGALGALENAILFEDAGLLVLDKPSGMAVHGGSGQRYGVIEALRALRPHAPYLELVHRAWIGRHPVASLSPRKGARCAYCMKDYANTGWINVTCCWWGANGAARDARSRWSYVRIF